MISQEPYTSCHNILSGLLNYFLQGRRYEFWTEGGGVGGDVPTNLSKILSCADGISEILCRPLFLFFFFARRFFKCAEMSVKHESFCQNVSYVP